ncbi:hypothetical protein RyT2_27540 [Pseudolactococcus yaeyamensis]
MRNLKQDANQTNYRAWKSGKRWLYASLALASVVGGIALETTGVTPKVLSYIQKDLGNDVVEALASTPTLLNRGDILQPDFYAKTGEFEVPASVASDFPNNAFVDYSSKITPGFSGNTYVIPSATDANAIAAYNQPLDPKKDFSISAEITVPNAQIGAAGIYISDVPTDEIVSKLGTGTGNGGGSSGSLKTNSYNGNYMLFSGFHNTGGYVAILSSGKDYSLENGNKSDYRDSDYVSLGGGTNGKNVTIQATIDYKVSTGIVTVTYNHNSKATPASKSVKYKINQNDPVYLGIVGNGAKSDSKGEYTSRTTVTAITGSYLSANRTVEFKDDAGNALFAPSRVLMPQGGRLGIGNADTTTPYYYDKPDAPQGYTYLASQNPSVGGDRSVTVTYQRDVQTGLVERINNATGQKMATAKNIDIKGLTNENKSINVPGISGYYYLNQISGVGVTSPTYAADGSTLDFKLAMDNTANGTATTDSQEQLVETYMMPSVQERILTITKPDGTTTTEKQVSNTDVDFTTLAGQYAIPGYRAVIDGKPVSDAQANLGIPGEATDHTDNLKATTDKTPQTHTITYQADGQKAMIVYRDVTTGTDIKTDNLSGVSDSLISYDMATNLKSYTNQGYAVKSNNFAAGSEKFDTDPNVDQTYLVELVHDTEEKKESKTINHEVKYSVDGGNALVPKPDYTLTANVDYLYYVDKVTGTKITSDFADYSVKGDATRNPVAPVYQEGKPTIPEVTVDPDGTITFDAPDAPDLDSRYITQVTENRTIHYNSIVTSGDTITSTVVYKYQGNVQLTTVPDIDFGTQIITSKNKGKVYPAVYSKDLVVDDNRKDVKDGWYLTVKQSTPFVSSNGQETLTNSLFFRVTDGGALTSLEGGGTLMVYNYTNQAPLGTLETIKPTSTWNQKADGAGFYLKDNGKVKAGDYSTTLTWELVAGPKV